MIRYFNQLILSIVCLLVSTLSMYAQTNISYRPMITNADISASIDNNLAVGKIPGGGGVTFMGSASYQIPIELPGGTNGMVPTLSLDYNSLTPNGLLGSGWSLNGISAITYTEKNNFFDGAPAGINLRNGSPFLLDGSRLVGLTGTYGTNNATYAKENHDFSVISSKSNTTGCTNCPAYFEVKTQNGLLIEYGKTADSKDLHSNGIDVTAWYINKISDNNSNYIEYVYTIINGEKLISEIKYTGNTSGSILPYHSVKFSYATREDKNSFYIGGSSLAAKALKKTNLLEKISVYTNTTELIREYKLIYGYDHFSYLSEIQLWGAAGERLNSTLFKYGADPQPSLTSVETSSIFSSEKADLFTGDFNGDGHTDIFAMYYTTKGLGGKPFYKSYKIFTKNPAGGYSLKCQDTLPASEMGGLWHFDPYIFDYSGIGTDHIVLSKYYEYASALFLMHSFVFINQDCGIAYQSDPNFNNNAEMISSSAYHRINRNGLYMGDFTGGGFKTIITHLYKDIYIGETKSSVKYSINAPLGPDFKNLAFETTHPYTIDHYFRKTNIGFPFDFDGDGKDELALFTSDSIWAFSFKQVGNELKTNLLFAHQISSLHPLSIEDIYAGDFNGDRKQDFLIRQKDDNLNPWFVFYSKGHTNDPEKFEKVALLLDDPYKTYSGTQNRILIGDYNNDGKDDFLVSYPVANNSTVSGSAIYYSTGVNYEAALGVLWDNNFKRVSLPNSTNGYYPYLASDFNGDGQIDVLQVSRNASDIIQPLKNLYIRPFEKKHLLHKIRDGLGNVFSFEYDPLTKGGTFYTKTTGGTWLYIYKPLSFYAVSKQTVPNGISTDQFEYQYTGFCYDLLRKKSVGFLSITEKNLSNGYSAKTEFNHFKFSTWDLRTNLPISQKVYKTSLGESNLTYHSSTDCTMNKYNNGTTTFDKVIWFQKNSETNKDFITGASALTTFTGYNGLTGLYTLSENKIFENTGASGAHLEKTTRQFTYTNSGTPVSTPKPTQIITGVERSGSTSSRTETYTYNTKGLLTQNVSWSGTPKSIIKTMTHDVFGNVRTVTLATTGENNRVQKYDYSDNGRYLVKEYTDHVDLNASVEYSSFNNRWGQPTQIKDINGKFTTVSYDNNWGFVTGTTDPLGNTKVYSRAWSTLHGSAYKVSEAISNGNDRNIFIDKLGRAVRNETIGFNSQIFYELNEYNSRGDIIKVTSPGANGIAIATQYTYNYDHPAGRVTAVSTPVASASVGYSYGYGKTTVSQSNSYTGWAHSQVSTSTTDAAGKVVAASDNGGTLTYKYDAFGNMSEVKSGTDVIQTAASDAYGNRASISDNSSGTISFEYNGFGELTKQTDAKSQQIQMTYDRAGRVKTRTVNGVPTNMTYIATGNGLGQLSAMSRPADNVSESYTYDAWGRPVTQNKVIGAESFSFSYTYNNAVNAIAQVNYPSGLAVKYGYNAQGYLTSITNGDDSKSFFSSPDINHWGQYKSFTLGAHLYNKVTKVTYNNYGNITNILATNPGGGGAGKFNYSYAWNDGTGNMVSRTDNLPTITQLETFGYDHLDRLTHFKIGITPDKETSYAANGNISSKFDAGSYNYSTTGSSPYAVTSIVLQNNSATNLGATALSKQDQNITYNAWDQPMKITEGTKELDFWYGADEQRIKSVYKEGSTTKYTRYYLGDFEREISGGVTRDIHYIESPAGTVGIVVKEGSTWNYYHTYTDALGSVLYVYKENGAIEARQSFDPWGRYRNAQHWTEYDVTDIPKPWLYRGFTGHEMLPGLGLVHMNGRMYDPVAARMLGADPIINNAFSTQAFNRYSYVWNNPLKYIDPTGYNGCGPIKCPRWDKEGKDIWQGVKDFFNNLGQAITDNVSAGAGPDKYHYMPNMENDASGYITNMAVAVNQILGGLSAEYAQGLFLSGGKGQINSTGNNSTNGIGAGSSQVLYAQGSVGDKSIQSSENDYVIGPGGKYLGEYVNNYGGVKGLTVNTFYGYYANHSGGLVISLSYTGAKANGANWAQKIYTDSPLGNKTSPYWDGDTGSIYYYTSDEIKRMTNGNTVSFYDNPSRNSDATWRAVLTLYNGKNRILSLSYGFTIKNGITTLYPIKIVYP